MGSSEFNYESAKRHLTNLDLEALGSRTMHFNTVAEEEADGGAGNQSHGGGHGRLMRLATWINLDSRFSVSAFVPLVLIISDRGRLVALERFLATSSEGGRRTTSRMIQI